MNRTDSSKGLKHSETSNNYSNNKYLMLLQRLDENEGLCEPSIEEKLKLAEDSLRLSCAKFCEAASTLLESNTTTAPEERTTPVFDPQTVQDMFRPECFKPSLRPAKSKLKTLSKEKPSVLSLKSEDRESKKHQRSRMMLKQAYYLPPSSWFSSEKSKTDLSHEEMELLSSCATKAFVKFLEEKKKEIPRIFSLASTDNEN